MLYEANRLSAPYWADFENQAAEKGRGGMTNKKAKGHAFDHLDAGATVTLMRAEGSGVVRRIWMTLSDRSPKMLRMLTLNMYWDDADTPAVSCPLGDFFGFALSQMTAYESALFSSPEGRSFNCFIPMPFYEGARITLTNESDVRLDRLFYDVDFTLEPLEPGKALYFHVYWHRESPTELTKDYVLLPTVKGHGRFLGTAIGVLSGPAYRHTWFGEGEVKMYLDGDDEYPTLAGTGIEDYIGTAWGQGVYAHSTQGSLISEIKEDRFCFYRWHTVDPIYFARELRVEVQQIGGADCQTVRALIQEGAKLKVVSSDSSAVGFACLYEIDGYALNDETAVESAWYNFYREDDYTSVAYFYLDRPVSDLPPLPPLPARTMGMAENLEK